MKNLLPHAALALLAIATLAINAKPEPTDYLPVVFTQNGTVMNQGAMTGRDGVPSHPCDAQASRKNGLMCMITVNTKSLTPDQSASFAGIKIPTQVGNQFVFYKRPELVGGLMDWQTAETVRKELELAKIPYQATQVRGVNGRDLGSKNNP